VRSPYRWVVLAVGTLGQASFSALSTGLPALAPALRDGYSLGLTQVGVALGSVGAGAMLGVLPWGILADRVGERRVAAVGLAGAAAALVGAAWSDGFVELVAALVAAGLFGTSVSAASGRAVMAWFGREERGLALGIRQTAVPLGGGAAAASLPWIVSSGGLRAAFLVLAAASLAAGVAGAVWMRERVGAVHPADPVDARPLRDRRLWLLAGASSLLLVTQITDVFFLVLFLHQHRAVRAGAAAALLALAQLLGAVARVGSGGWSDRLGARIVPLRRLALAIAATTVLVALLGDAPLWLLVPTLLAASGAALSWNGLSFTAAAELAGGAASGAALGFQQTVLWLVAAVVPVGFAALVDATSWRLGFALAALCPLLGYAALRPLAER
jgi:sugar phosphate permease